MPPKTIKKASSAKRKSLTRARTAGTTSRSGLVPPVEEDLFARAFRASPHPIGVTELDSGCCLEINDACLEILGFQRHEVIGKTTLMLGIWPDPRERAQFIDRLKAEGSVRNLEVSMRMKDGNLRQFLISTDLLSLNGKQCLLTMGNDITEQKQAEAERQKFVSLADRSVEFIGMCDLNFKPFYVNEAGRRLVGLDSLEQACEVRVQDYFFPEDQAMIIGEFFPSVLRHGHGEIVVRFRHFKTDEALWMIYNVFQVMDENGRVTGYATVSRDITERKRAEEALRRAHEELEHRVAERTAELGRSNKRLQAEITERKQAEAVLRRSGEQFRTVVESAPNGILLVDGGGRIVLVNGQIERQFGYRREELISHPVERLLPGHFRRDHAGLRETYQKAPAARAMGRGRDLYGLRKDGSELPLEIGLSPIETTSGTMVLASVVDITERKQAEEALHQKQLELQQSQAQLQDLASKLLTAQDRERQRIARDLHDDFSQRLVALTLDLAALDRQPSLSPESLGKALEPVREELAQLSDDLRRLAHRLHPSLLKHAGLRAALEEHIQQAMKRTELHITLKVGNVPESLPLDSATCLFRVCQESLQNVVKHANATDVLVKLSGSAKGIGLSVTDNGKGFDVHNKRNHRKGLGLISMQERLRLVKGFLNIHSRPADGTKVCAWIPFQENTP